MFRYHITSHKEILYFYHDALHQLTSNSNIEWMKHKGSYKRWLNQQICLNGSTPYIYQPVGNMPEFMHLDISSNNDIQANVSLHYAIRGYLDNIDRQKSIIGYPKNDSQWNQLHIREWQ